MRPWPADRSPHDPFAVSVGDLAGAEVVRDRRLLCDPRVAGGAVELVVAGRAGRQAPLSFDAAGTLTLGCKGRWREPSLALYAGALETGRAIDVLGCRTAAGFAPLAFWCSARYDGQRMHGSRKSDPQFVWKLASAAKDERIAAGWLRKLGHDLCGEAVDEEPPYVVVIAARLGGRRDRADLECVQCGLRFEVKGRPNDSLVRFSDSEARTFAQENRRQDFQLLVVRHRTVHAYHNAEIIDKLAHALRASDGTDDWISFDGDAPRECRLPDCAGHGARLTA
jgi:hypothetical protein